jgi:hypothetical protein
MIIRPVRAVSRSEGVVPRSEGRARRRAATLGALLVATFTPLAAPASAQTAAPTPTPTPAPMSMQMPTGPDKCQLPQLAFCDTFQTIVGGGREGDLDPAKWSFTRMTSDVSPFPLTTSNTYHSALAQFCRTTKKVQPDNDSFICGAQFGESNHWMETINDFGKYDTSVRLPDGTHPQISQGYYVANANRIRQPFDFAGRTGNIVFDVDAHVDGSGNDRPHGWWPEVWLTDQPMQGPHLDHPGTHLFPQNGIGFVLNDCPGARTNQEVNSLNQIAVFNNYKEKDLKIPSPHDCFTTRADDANHFQIKVSQTHVEFWGSNKGGTNFRMLASVNVSLNFSRGYLSFEHASYNAAKYGSTNTSTYHWHAIGFDGPILPADRGYEVPDALHTVTAADRAKGSAVEAGSVNLGYQVGAVGCNRPGCSTPTFSLAGVNPANALHAYLTYTVWYDLAPHRMTATVNGVPYTFADPNTDGTGPGCNDGCGVGWRPMVQPIPLSALKAGTNKVSFSDPGSKGQNPTIANIDLEIVPKTA